MRQPFLFLSFLTYWPISQVYWYNTSFKVKYDKKNREQSGISYTMRSNKAATQLNRVVTLCATLGLGVCKPVCRRWFSKYCSGNKHLEDKKRSGRRSMIDKQELSCSIEANPTQTRPNLAQKFGTSHTTIAYHLHTFSKKTKLLLMS